MEQGKVRGKTSVDYEGGTYYSFLGIPYARSPVGEFRFKVSNYSFPGTTIKFKCLLCGIITLN